MRTTAEFSLLVIALLFAITAVTEEPAQAQYEDSQTGRTVISEVPWEPFGPEDKVIYGEDDRLDVYAETGPARVALAGPVCALVDAARVTGNGDGAYALSLAAYEWIGFEPCPEEPFSDQPALAYCSGFLVAEDLVATAGHCYDEGDLADTRFVFGFVMEDAATPVSVVDASQVYTGVEVVSGVYTYGADYAIVRLDRPVDAPGAFPLGIRREGKVPFGAHVGVIGHPAGLPMKIAFGEATTVHGNDDPAFFTANTDTYGGNSGSPVFNAATGIVEGILVRGYALDYEYQTEEDCVLSTILPDDPSYEEATRTTEFAALIPQTGHSGGSIWFDRLYYPCGGHVEAHVLEGDLEGALDVSIETGAGDIETLQLTESGEGHFAATLAIDTGNPTAENGLLETFSGDVIVAYYHDAENGMGVSETVTASASIDCVPPVVTGIRVVKAFSQEPHEVKRFGVRSQEVSQATYVAGSLDATYFPLLSLVSMLGTFFVWYFGGLGVMNESLSFGVLMAFLAYLGMLYGPLQMLTQFGNFMNRAFTAAQRIFEITDADQELYEDADAVQLNAPRGAFEFDKVTFGYVKDRPVLKGVEVKVEAGEMIGLVGRSGVGKTTMTNLICRFYDVEEGAIRIDGVDLRKVRLRDLRRHIGIVPQESYLFDGTVAENIAFGKPDATKEEIIRAAITANAHGFVMRLPDGYDSRVGEGGSRLSGGEKQRIAIARAILHEPKILILDEATSSMDTETEELIQEALARLVKNRTTFAIAHRLSTLRNADRLLVIDDGKVAEFGTHGELLASNGIYSKLVETQSKLSAIRAVDG